MKTEYHLSKYVRSFFEDQLIRRRNLSPCTVHSYRDTIKLFVQFTTMKLKKDVASLLATDIKEPLVVDFLTYLEKERANTIQTRNHRRGLLRRLFGFISLQEPLLSEHCRKILDIPIKKGATQPEITYLEKDELDGMFKAISTKTALGRRDYAMLLFMYNTGARAQEVSDARISWVSFTNPFRVEILGKGRKLRTCPLWENTSEILRRLISEQTEADEQNPHLFINRMGQPLSRFGIFNIVRKYKQRASEYMPGLRHKRITPHTIRHTTAMHLLQSGVDINVIRSWLGHANLITTHRYVEIDMAMKRQALESCKPSTKSSPKLHCTNPDIIAWLESL